MSAKKLNKKKHVLLSLQAIRLLRKVQRVLRDHPKLYAQEIDSKPEGGPKDECGSPSCICGWMRYFAKSAFGWTYHPEQVGLTSEQFMRLFYRGNWPRPYRGNGNNEGTPPGVAIARIDRFIETDGVE